MVIRNFTRVSTVDDMPLNEMCSYCYVTKLQMMQSSPYSFYDDFYKRNFEVVQSKCGVSGDTSIPSSLIIEKPEEEAPFCLSDVTYTTVQGDTCTSIALDFSVASAALYIGNQVLIRDCSRVVPDQEICIPLSCQYTHVLQANDKCDRIEGANFDTMIDPTTGIAFTLRDLNPWIDPFCTNLHDTSTAHSHVVYLTPQGGVYNATNPATPGYDPNNADLSGWGSKLVEPPENTTVADGTTLRCGEWHTALQSVRASITHPLFVAVNPSLGVDSLACSGSLVPGLTYCTGPLRGWNYTVSSD